MISKACEYGIKALLFMSTKSNEQSRVTLNEISTAINSPVAFTSKILQKLVAAGIITSVKGTGGGYQITPAKIKSTRLRHIIEAIEGEAALVGCFLGLPKCSDAKPCPVHHMYGPIREMLHKSLFDMSLFDIIKNEGNLM